MSLLPTPGSPSLPFCTWHFIMRSFSRLTKQRSQAIHLCPWHTRQFGGALQMGISRFSVGTRLRWQGKTYEVRLSTSVNTVALRETLTEEETSVDTQTLLKALF